jgi:hypothetical protein
MSAPEDQIVRNHFQGRLENNLVSSGLPKLHIKAVVRIPDSAVGFDYFSHIFPLWPNPDYPVRIK